MSQLSLIIIVYYVLASVVSLILGIVQPAIGIPEVIIELTQFGPAIAVFAVLSIIPRSRSLSLSSSGAGGASSNADPRRLVEAILLALAIFVISLIWYRISAHTIDYSAPSSLSHPFWLIIVAQFIGAAGEEIGWRMFLQPVLQTRISVLASSVVVGLMWGVWHVGVFAEGWLYAGAFLLSAVSISVILGELLRGSRGYKLATATTLHTLINLGMLLWFKEESGDAYAMVTLALACTIVAVGTLIIHAARTRNGIRQSLSKKII
ncbi:CPBP family intramembrane glutamic endopeptidase [Paenibacillus spongiae]|uniref:CPBP family intramembrane metalloprotease n=1 Tax=Paenibacillus spongiae TaxID=2909671 RepID=A0ABY5S5T9_9BACL|nr:CPBP family intramembrane glutamic endopeptidase [Paenibacillus spongiae]UVI29266.1 CPBP family intramembrane metalloprotease [Paenibacillus spongiae]